MDKREELLELVNCVDDEDLDQLIRHIEDLIEHRTQLDSYVERIEKSTGKRKEVLLQMRTDEMWRYYCSGETLQNIAERYELSRQRVQQLFKCAGYEMRSRGYRKDTEKPTTT